MTSRTNKDESSQELHRRPLTVDCRTRIASELGDIPSWADIAAICHVALKEALSYRSEEVFIGEFFEVEATSTNNNPNCPMLDKLTENVQRIAASEMRHEMEASSALELFLDEVSRVDLEAFGLESLNAVTPYWAIIRGINYAYGDNQKFDSHKRRGPLNVVHRDRVGVYLSAPASAMSTALYLSGLRRIPEFTFNNQLWYISFYERCGNPCLPKLKLTTNETLDGRQQPLPPSQQEGLVWSHSAGLAKAEQPDTLDNWPLHVRIGMALFSPVSVAGIAHPSGTDSGKGDSDAPISFTAKRGRALSATYRKGYADKFRDVVIGALNACARHGCHIVVFPEVVISPDLRQVICDYLASPDLAQRPLLVVAGSSWEPSEELGDNVSFLYDGHGHEIGRYYKYTPYGTFEDTGHIKFIEGLDMPGKECTIVDIAGLGRVLPSICKDLASDAGHTIGLARAFSPNFVCTPALSPSMDTGFSAPIDLLSERSLAISVVCNQCGHMKARKQGDTTVSMVGAPLKSAEMSSRTQCTHMSITRDTQCQGTCLAQHDQEAPTSCVRIIDIDCNAFADEGYVTSQRIPLHQMN